ncbi:alpha-amylase [Mycobacterium sp. MS1601]|uniref:alpha-amylase family glycosyl hydrolase n=1 Tax=Mycobacterium sp. MS1601 TaxID=1936029 RepID=UPI00097925F6|nr:alpha-amylase family glycosyl hydrolase [Mycobacterium sp. MS1601]AQA05356.1 alpha-amylase [Mycobacterium sp. MS1601]
MTEAEWVKHAIWWQIYPLGFVGAYPADVAPGLEEHRLLRVIDWLDHAIALGASGIALGPVFASRTHGYDTTDHKRIDPRLGDDNDFDAVIQQAHERGLRVLLDGVFNHVGTDFPAYRAALDGDEEAARWFRGRPGRFHTFEGHGELITLNHNNPAVVDYIVDVMNHWLDRGADGWRLDAAYAVPQRFWAQVLPRVREAHPQAWFVGEVIHGDYVGMVSQAGFDAVTQYELWKAIWSSLNDGNFHELNWALRRHNDFLASFVPQTFIGNHDVTRIASKLERPEHVAHAAVLLMTLGGVPTIYAGDEFGFQGIKEDRAGGDDAVRPEFGVPPFPADAVGRDLFALHQFLIGLRRRHPWLHTARTTAVEVDNRGYVYETRGEDHALVVALNIDDAPLPVDVPGLVIAGSGAPPQERVQHTQVPPHGWLILEP